MTAALLEPYRPALTGHCYRMLGSVVEAEDAVQEAMLRAWKSLGRFEERAQLKTWLYRIATNVCLDAIEANRRRRVRPVEASSEPGVVGDGLVLTERPREHWVEPIPDAAALPAEDQSGPEELAVLRESIRLAFVAALQYLPARQRAVLLLTQVLNWSAAETAAALDMSVAAVNSALQRARATLGARNPAVAPRAITEEQERLVARYVEAFERYNVDALSAMLHEEATLSMPPYETLAPRPGIHRGLDADARRRGPGLPLVPVAACGGTPTFAQYREGGAQPWALIVLELGADHAGADRVTSVTSFLDVETLFPRFGLPARLTD